MKHWIGCWLMAVPALHPVVAVVLQHGVMGSVIERGVFNTVGSDKAVGAAA